MIKRKTFIKGTVIGLFSIFLASCSENDMRERVRALAQSSELSTVEYTITKVIKAKIQYLGKESNTTWLWLTQTHNVDSKAVENNTGATF